MSSGADAQSASWLDDVSVVVLSYNRKDELLNNLPALCEASRQTGFELIVVDNASTDGSRELLAELASTYPDLVLLLNNTNTGVAEGRNTGWRAARGAYILQIDDDTRIDVDAIAGLRKILEKEPYVGVLSPKVFDVNTKRVLYDYGQTPTSVANFIGGCHMFSRQLLKDVGYNDLECFFGGEELDYSIRVRERGLDVLYWPYISVWHNGIRRSGDEGAVRRQRWVRSFSYVFFRYFPAHKSIIFFSRYLLSHFVSAWQATGPTAAFSLIGCSLRGAMIGRRRHRQVSKRVVDFYANPTTRPEFGNVPLVTKLKNWRNRRSR